MYTEMPVADMTCSAEATTPVLQTTVAAPESLLLKEKAPAGGKPQILDDVVIEEVSIDGMCGVY